MSKEVLDIPIGVRDGHSFITLNTYLPNNPVEPNTMIDLDIIDIVFHVPFWCHLLSSQQNKIVDNNNVN